MTKRRNQRSDKSAPQQGEQLDPVAGPRRKVPWFYMIAAMLVGLLLAQFLPTIGSAGKSGSPSADVRLEQARKLEAEGRWSTALEVYAQIASDYSTASDQNRSEAAEQMANIQFVHFRDSEAARRSIELAAFHTSLPARKKELETRARDLPRLPSPAPAAAGLQPAPENHTVIARVGETPVTLEEIVYAWERAYKGEPMTAEALPDFIDSYMNTVLLAQQARVLKLDQNDRLKHEVRLYENQMLSKAVQKTLDARPNDAEIEAFYKENAERYMVPPSVRLQHIVVRDAAESEQVGVRLSEGESFDRVGKSMSLDRETLEGGVDLGWINEGNSFIPYLGTIPAVADRMLRHEEGFTTGPFETARGFHWIRVAEKKGEAPQPLAEVRLQIEKELAAKKFQQLQDDLIAELKQTMETSIDSEALRKAIQNGRVSDSDAKPPANQPLVGPVQSVGGGLP